MVDATSTLHPYFTHRLDAGPIRPTTIAHVFNYQVAVLRDGIRLAVRVGRSRRAEGQILEDTVVPWGHQVAVMFQIVSALVLEVPTFLQEIDKLQGVLPNVQLSCEPWGHVDHSGVDCGCLSSDSTGAYVHSLSLISREGSPERGLEDFSTPPGEDGARMSEPSVVCEGRPGSMPFVSRRPGAYGRLLLAVYVRWKTGLLVASDWLRPVARGGGGGWRVDPPVTLCR